MKTIKKNLTFLAAKELADKLAVETGKIHSVRMHKTTTPATYFVVEGMIGNEVWCKYTARPETLQWIADHKQDPWGQSNR